MRLMLRHEWGWMREREKERKRENVWARKREWDTGGDYHSFIHYFRLRKRSLPVFSSSFRLFLRGLGNWQEMMTRKFEVAFLQWKSCSFQFLFFLSLRERMELKREFNLCWNIRKENMKRGDRFFYCFLLHISFPAFQNRDRIRNSNSVLYSYKIFPFRPFFSYNDDATMRMLRVTCVCELFTQKMRTFTPQFTLCSKLYYAGDKRWERVISVLFSFRRWKKKHMTRDDIIDL